jgi:hypothetical protein
VIEHALGELLDAVFDTRDTLEPEELSPVIAVELPDQGIGAQPRQSAGGFVVNRHGHRFANTRVETSTSSCPDQLVVLGGHAHLLAARA